jgi:hypothetical protein
MHLTLENLGRRPVAIVGAKVSFSLFTDPSPFEVIHYTTDPMYMAAQIIVQPNQIEVVSINLESDFGKYGYNTAERLVNELKQNRPNIKPSPIELMLSTGEKLRCELNKIAN